MPESGDSTGYSIQMASDEVLAQREELADRVCVELRRAGLPAQRGSADTQWLAGAVVTVDRIADDDGGGVFVEWNTDPGLSRAAAGIPEGDPDDQALFAAAGALAHRGDDPAVLHLGAVSRHMQQAIIGILSSAGLRAYDPEIDDPYSVQVEVQ